MGYTDKIRKKKKSDSHRTTVSGNLDWPYKLTQEWDDEQVSEFKSNINNLGNQSQYGWGHTIDFARFKQDGVLGDAWQLIPIFLDEHQWWPDLRNLSVADVGCYSGAITLIMAHRKPKIVYAVDEVPENLDQCKFLCNAFAVNNVRHINRSVYHLMEEIEPGSLDLILLSGVLYHLSDMLLGLYIMRKLLKTEGILIIESNADEDDEASYANFGRFHAGMWWQPTSLCIKDMCKFMGLEVTNLDFYRKGRCLVRAVRTSEAEIPFKRGMNWEFETIKDDRPRVIDASIMAPKKPTK